MLLRRLVILAEDFHAWTALHLVDGLALVEAGWQAASAFSIDWTLREIDLSIGIVDRLDSVVPLHALYRLDID